MTNKYDDLILTSADKYGVDPARLKAHVDQESSFKSTAYNAESGATGLGQFTPDTAKSLGIDPKDPKQAIDGMGRLLAENQAALGDPSKASAAYFGGPNPQRWGKKTEAYQAAVDQKTQQYSKDFKPASFLPDSMMKDLQSATGGSGSASYVPDSVMSDLTAAVKKPSSVASQVIQSSPSNPTQDADSPGRVATFGAALGHSLGRSVLGVQQLVGKGLQQLDATKPAGDWLYNDATQGAKNLDAQLDPYQQANPKTAVAGEVTGAVVNPLNRIVPMGSGGGLIKTIGQNAASGAALSTLTNPVTDEDGSFLEQKARQGLYGAAGGAVGGVVGSMIPTIISGANKIIGSLKSMATLNATDATGQATKIVADQFAKQGVDVAKLEPTLFQGLRDQVADAIKSGRQVDEKALARLTDAQTLPVPVPMLKGQISRDAMQFAKEQNLRGIQGVGEPITETLTKQNRALIDNMNVMGAQDAPSMMDTGQRLVGGLKGYANQLQQQVSDAYAKVRGMDGQSVPMDVATFTKSANAALDAGGRLGGFLPKSIESQFNDIATGKMPLTVDIAQRLDQIWGKEARSVGGSAETAINTIRSALREAPLSGAGQDAMNAYTAAQSLARTRFQTIDSNPALKAVIDGVEPDQFVRKYVLGGNAANITSMVNMLGKTDPGALDALRATTMDFIKRKALNGASDENGVFSQAAFNKTVNDPYMSERLKALMTPDQMSMLGQLGRTAENALSFPKASAVNTSNTTSSAANIIKSEVESRPLSQILNVAEKVPGLASAASNLRAGLGTQRLSSLVADAMTPDVGGKMKLDEDTLAALARLSGTAQRASTRAGAGYGAEKWRQNDQANKR